MLQKAEIQQVIEPYLQEHGLFLVNIGISARNDIEIYVDRMSGEVSIDDCAAINDIFENAFDREKEDYSLMVSSAGLDMPFMVARQFEKFMGSQVQITLKKGGWVKGTLTGYSEQGIELTIARLVKEEGMKKKVERKIATLYPLAEVKSCKPVVEFK